MADPLVETRLALQQVAVHVLARRRYAATGRFGLRPSPGGIATPAFGDGPEAVRTCADFLVVERGADAVGVSLSTLGDAAAAAGVELDAEFSVGDDTPALIDPDRPLDLDPDALDALAAWFALGSVAIDEVVATTPAMAAATTRQIWPEHFDLGGAVTLRRPDGTEVKANLGASPGDGYEPHPYLYVGPWTEDRPGDPSFWNAPFGASLRLADLDPTAPGPQASAFLHEALTHLAR